MPVYKKLKKTLSSTLTAPKIQLPGQKLELFWKGEFSIDENEEPKEDAGAPTILKKEESEVAAGPINVSEVVATPYQGSTTNIHPYLSSLVNYTCPMKFQGFDFAEQKNLSHKVNYIKP